MPTGLIERRPSPYAAGMSATVGDLIKEWRARRARSQLDVALEVGVSPRHLSFVETGRSKPSPELVLAVADHLEVPLRERNAMLLAAGFAPRYRQQPMDAEPMRRITASLERLLDAHDPFPGVALDRSWNVVLANRAAGRLVDLVDPALTADGVNVFRISLHPDGLAAATVNFDEWATYLLGELHRLARTTADPEVAALRDEIDAYPNVVDLRRRRDWTVPHADPDPVVSCTLALSGAELSLYTTLTTFGTPRDVTLDELVVELFFPADGATEAVLRALDDQAGRPAAAGTTG